MNEQKTLKQQLQERAKQNWVWKNRTSEQIINDVLIETKLWLEQKRQEYGDTKGEFWSLEVDKEYKKLLLELEEK